ncbi:hypothetical protein [Shewanella algae]|jgi:hypothetical protein|uniref:hypothetical protein n=1 Tax=Shewanella algae TaxID=38313 RepID=UPI001183EDA7|nr:hypothetical protein [Shewanella algae]
MQRAIDIQKVSDLKESSESDNERTVWFVDGEEFVYKKGADYLLSRAGINSTWEIWPLGKSDKRAAKSKVFKLIG